MQMRLTTWDKSTMCIVEENPFEVSEFALESLVGNSLDKSYSLEFDIEESLKLCAKLGISISAKFDYATIQPHHFVNSFPYLVHTNRELTLMLAGTKPLAAFVESFANDTKLFAEDVFDNYVTQGRFVKREYVQLEFRGDPRRLRRILYARTGEEWRIDAFILLWHTAEKSGFSELFERLEGSLLGYEEWQNDAFIEIRRMRNLKLHTNS